MAGPAQSGGYGVSDADAAIAEQDELLRQRQEQDLQMANTPAVALPASPPDQNQSLPETPVEGYETPANPAPASEYAAPPGRLIVQQEQTVPEPAPVPAQPPIVRPQVAKPKIDAQPQAMNVRNFRQKLIEGIDENTAAQNAASKGINEATQRANEAQERLTSKHGVDMAIKDEELRQAYDDYRQARTPIAQKLHALNQEIANTQIGDRRSTRQKVLGALAVGLGQATDQNNLVAGLMQGLNVQTHNADSIQQHISAAIDRDIDAQKAMLENKRFAAAGLHSQLGLAREAFGDDAHAIEWTKASLKEQYGDEMEQVARSLNNDVARHTALAKAAELKLQGEADKAKVYREVEARNQAAAAARAKAATNWGSYDLPTLEAMARSGHLPADGLNFLNGVYAKDIANQQAYANVDKTQAETLSKGGMSEVGSELPGGLVLKNPRVWAQLSDAQKSKLSDQAVNNSEMISLINDIEKLRKDNPNFRAIAGTDAYRTLEGYQGQLMMKAKKAEEMGSLDNGVIAAVKNLAGDVTSWWGSPDSKLSAYKATIARDTANRVGKYGAGFMPGDPTQQAALENLTRPR